MYYLHCICNSTKSMYNNYIFCIEDIVSDAGK